MDNSVQDQGTGNGGGEKEKPPAAAAEEGAFEAVGQEFMLPTLGQEEQDKVS